MARHVDGYLNFDTNINTKGFNKGLGNVNSSLGSVGTMLRRIAALAAAAFSVRAVANFGKTCVNTATEVENAWIGLNSIINGQGKSFNNAKKFIEEYISDGLVPLKNAVTAYKNLTLRGYSEEQVEAVMNSLKNSATYARQSQYSLGDAVTTATEGLKNENSILVDNAGVTKNVAKMWKDYAKNIGVSYTSLTKEQKIEAEVQGILEETKFQMGDAAKYTNSYSGQLAILSANFTNLKVKIGNIVKVFTAQVLPVLNVAIDQVEKLVDRFTVFLNSMGIQTDVVSTLESLSDSDLSDLSSTAEDTAENIEETTKEAEKLKKKLAGFDELNVMEQAEISATETDTEEKSDTNTLPTTDITTSVNTAKVEGEVNGLLEIIEKAWGKLQKICEPLKTELTELWETLKKIGGFAGENLINFYDHFLKPLGTWIMGEGLPQLVDILDNTLQSIDFEKINTSLDNLYKVVEPFAEDVGEGLLWFCDEVLSPLSTWVVNDVVPEFLDAIAGALDLIDSIGQTAGDILKFIWDNFLSKIASFVGDAAVVFLDAFGNFLSDVANNQTAVTTILSLATAVGVFVGGITLLNIALAVMNALFAVNPFTWLLIALGAIVVVIIEVITYWEDLKWIFSEGIKFWIEKFKSFGKFITEGFANTFPGLIESVKSIVQGVKDQFSGIIKFFTGVFTGDWEKAWEGIKQIFKGVWETLKGVMTAPINTIIDIINSFIGGIEDKINLVILALNTFGFDIPDWVPGIGGESVGFNIDYIDIPDIPHLATGTVVPANYGEFAAILGDNKRETEVVSPLSTMKQAMLEALAESGLMGGNNDGDIVINIDGREVFRVVRKQNDSHKRTHGGKSAFA